MEDAQSVDDMRRKYEKNEKRKDMENVTKRISVTGEVKCKIAKAFRCSERLVRYALDFDEKHGNTARAARIRKMAMENGGEVMLTMPERLWMQERGRID